MPDWLILLLAGIIASGAGWLTIRGTNQLTKAKTQKTGAETADLQEKRISGMQTQVDDIWDSRNEAMKMVEEERTRRLELETEVHQLQNEVNKLKQDVAARDAKIADYEKEEELLRETITTLKKEAATLHEIIITLELEIKKLKEKRNGA
jgi:chromosome segregation ATPase